MIYDRNFEPLVNDKVTYKAIVLPTAVAMAEITELLPNDKRVAILNKFSEGKPFLIDLGDDFDKNKKYENIDIFAIKSRYSQEGTAKHAIGYLSGDSKSGISGIEKAYDDFMQSQGGELKVRYSVDAVGNVLVGAVAQVEDSEYNSKKGVVLTIDKTIQKITENAAHKKIEKGAVVVMDVENGDLLSLVSVPEFDQNDITKSISKSDGALLNRTMIQYNVGSTFKLCVAAAALENGISYKETGYCPGYYTVSGIKFNCHFSAGHGVLDMKGALGISCNPYFIELGQKVGARAILSMATALGFGRSTAFAENMYSSAGILPSETSIDNLPALANLSFGQGDLMATPIQIATMISAIANGGTRVTPRLVKGISNDSGTSVETETNPGIANKAMSKETAALLREFMIFTVEEKSGIAAKPDFLSAGGKTASAETGISDGNGKMIVQAWFSGFYPAENPKYAIVVLNEGKESGGEWAAPVFKDIADGIYERFYK